MTTRGLWQLQVMVGEPSGDTLPNVVPNRHFSAGEYANERAMRDVRRDPRSVIEQVRRRNRLSGRIVRQLEILKFLIRGRLWHIDENGPLRALRSLGKFILEETQKWEKVVKFAGLKPE